MFLIEILCFFKAYFYLYRDIITEWHKERRWKVFNPPPSLPPLDQMRFKSISSAYTMNKITHSPLRKTQKFALKKVI